MKNHISKSSVLLTLATFLLGVNLTGCSMVHGNLESIYIPKGTSAPPTVATSSIPADNTAPVIDALDIIIPYGTSLQLAEIASITDDQDDSPSLKIDSIHTIAKDNNQKTVAPAEGSTLSATASTASRAVIEEVSVSGLADDSAKVTVSNDTTAVISKKDGDAAATELSEPVEKTVIGTTSETAEKDAAGDDYLFSTPGQYSVTLKGTDKSGNESTKAITVTVTDNIPPTFNGLREAFSIADKDKDKPDYLEGITASDEIDGDITAEIKVDDSTVQYGKVGTYSVSYVVSDASGNQKAATTPVVIKDTTSPNLTLSVSEINLFVTDKKTDYSKYASANDTVDGNVIDTLTVDDSAVKYKEPGEYSVKLSVQDKSGNTTTESLKVNISAGWKTQNGKKYYYSLQDGHLYHSWSHIDDKLYYFDPDDGHMLTGLQTIEGKQYLLDDKDGHQITGWQTIDGKKYYFSPDDGHMYHSWSNINGKEYYFDPAKGCLLTGLLTIDGDQYLLDESDGHQVTGWQTIDGNKYYFSQDDGHMYHDWSNIDGTEYYFDKSDGHMYTGTHYIDGEEYDFGTSGAAKKVVQQRSLGNSGSSSSGSSYIGNRNTHKFHYASCSSVRQMKDKNKVWFDSRSDAINSGYVPCQRCHP